MSLLWRVAKRKIITSNWNCGRTLSKAWANQKKKTLFKEFKWPGNGGDLRGKGGIRNAKLFNRKCNDYWMICGKTKERMKANPSEAGSSPRNQLPFQPKGKFPLKMPTKFQWKIKQRFFLSSPLLCSGLFSSVKLFRSKHKLLSGILCFFAKDTNHCSFMVTSLSLFSPPLAHLRFLFDFEFKLPFFQSLRKYILIENIWEEKMGRRRGVQNLVSSITTKRWVPGMTTATPPLPRGFIGVLKRVNWYDFDWP